MPDFQNVKSQNSPHPPTVPALNQISTVNGVDAGLIFVYGKAIEIRILFDTLLKMWNYRAVAFENLDQLIETAAVESPDLILVDSVFPFDENLEILRSMRCQGVIGNLPIVVISGFSQAQFREQAIAAGATDYLRKPVDFDTLEVSLRHNVYKSGNRKISDGNYV